MAVLRRVAAATLPILMLADVAAAHEVGATRFDAPIPLSLLFLGAGATVAVTAAWLGRGVGTRPRRTAPLATVSPRVVRSLPALGRLLFLTAVGFAVYRGLVGRQAVAENVATVFVWPLWLKGLGLIAILFGSPWPALSPWRAVHSLFERLERSEIGLAAYPRSLGVWPAVLGFVAVVGIVENLTVVPRSPRFTAGLVALYAATMLLGGTSFGRSWYRNADFLEVLYAQFARVAPVELGAKDGRYALSLRVPWRGCTAPATRPGAVAFVVAMVYTVSFDGFTSAPEYQQLLFAVRNGLGTGSRAEVLLYLLGLAVFVGGFAAATTAVEGIGAADGARSAAARAFVPTVIPIAAAYEVAHNYPFVVRNVGRAIGLLLGAAGFPQTTVSLLGWLPLSVFWATQVALVVAGHLVAVVAAHEVAVDRYETVADARRAHLPLVVVMVGYTVLSLWIVSRPVISG